MPDPLPKRSSLEGGSNYYAKLRGQTAKMSNRLVEGHAASPEYFRALGVRLVQGRLFTAADIEKALAYDSTLVPIFQSGVVSDVRERGLTEKAVPEAYEPFTGGPRQLLVLHAPLPPSTLTAEARGALAKVDAGLPLYNARTMDEVVAGQAQGREVLSMLVGSFAGLAAILAAIGICGVLSYLVTQRTREIGIRMSLGASRARVLGELLGEGIRLTSIGLAVGIAGAFAAGRIMASPLHEIQPGDPAIFLATACLLAAVAVAACYIPARRAVRLDPMNALRYE
jgi:hypothetical protein